MALVEGSKIRIACPAGVEKKFASFYNAFNGKTGKIVSILLEPPYVKVALKGLGNQYINVDRSWLAAI